MTPDLLGRIVDFRGKYVDNDSVFLDNDDRNDLKKLLVNLGYQDRTDDLYTRETEAFTLDNFFSCLDELKGEVHKDKYCTYINLATEMELDYFVETYQKARKLNARLEIHSGVGALAGGLSTLGVVGTFVFSTTSFLVAFGSLALPVFGAGVGIGSCYLINKSNFKLVNKMKKTYLPYLKTGKAALDQALTIK